MRALFIAGLILIWLPVVLTKPHVGVMVWSWVSHMNPHAEAYGFAYSFPFLDLIAVATASGLVFSKDNRVPPAHPLTLLMIVYLLWTLLTALTAVETAGVEYRLVKFAKIMIFALLSMTLIRTPERLKIFFYIIVASFAYYAVSGAIFTIATGGSFRVQAGVGMIQDNNQLAMALVMSFPLAVYLVQHPPMGWLWTRWPMAFMALTFFISVIGSQSRGGVAALVITCGAMLLRLQRKLLILLIAVPVMIGTIQFMPQSWKDRIESTENATEDDSFVGRVIMWKFATNVVEESPVTGGGFGVFSAREGRYLFMPFGHRAMAPHSSYFEVLGEHGYGGLFIWLTLIFTAWFRAGTQVRRYRAYTETRWLGDMSAMLQVSIVGFCAGSLTIHLSLFDLIYHVIAMIVMVHVVGERLMEGPLTPYIKKSTKKVKPARPKFKPSGQLGHFGHH